MKGSIDSVTWEEISEEVRQVNGGLFDIISEISPSQKDYFYKVSYPFGSCLIKDGFLYVPDKHGDVKPVTDDTVSSAFRNDVSYASNGIPVGLTLKNAFEDYIVGPERLLPAVTAMPGSVFALWKHLDLKPAHHPINLFNVRAGGTSMFMLPNIGDMMFHKHLKRDYGVSFQAPKSLSEQHEVFVKLISNTKSDWTLDVLYFPGFWLEKARVKKSWQKLYRYFLENAWNSSAFERNQSFYNYALSCAQASRNLKPNPYILDTLKHILAIVCGSVPGFKPATDESMGPIKLIQEAYVESYGLKKYAPTIMHPAHFDMKTKSDDPVYYSLQHPTTISFAPKSRKLSSTLTDVRELRHIMNTFLDEVSSKAMLLENTIIDHIPQLVEFDYFHNKPDQHGEIKLSSSLEEHDANLKCVLYEGASQNFAEHSLFLRGCIQIAHKKDSV